MKPLITTMAVLTSQIVAFAQDSAGASQSFVSRPVTIQHVTVTSRRDFAATSLEFEKQIGIFDPEAVKALGEPNPDIALTKAKIEAMAGSSGFMRFGVIQKFGQLLAVAGMPVGKANQYVIGNPLIALQMVRHKLGAGLYVPLRVLISEDAGGVTHFEYDLPSSLLYQFGDPDVHAVAVTLDQKLSALISASAGL